MLVLCFSKKSAHSYTGNPILQSATEWNLGMSITDCKYYRVDLAIEYEYAIVEKELQSLMFDPFMLSQEDVNLMKGLNFDAYRFSISWSRIFPGMSNLTGVVAY